MARVEKKYFTEVLKDGQIQVKTVTTINGVSSNHRHVVDVGDDCTNECAAVKRIAKREHTPARIRARKEAKRNNRIT